MSYIQNKDVFAGSALREVNFSNIRELSLDEIEEVNGGLLPALIGLGLRCAASTACRVAVIAGAGAVAAAVGYENNRV